jgi:multisubunit Na+/H+ antiporter MnhG subunit
MVENEGRNNISRHILPTSSNLLGLCFVILTFIKLSKIANETIIDETIGVIIFSFLVSSILSYTSMRAKRKFELYEKIADLIFLLGLFLLAVISLVIVFEAL